MSIGTIGEAGRRCAQAFVQAVTTLDSGSPPLTVNAGLKDQLGRFKIWAGNLGVFAGGHLSTDYRLRDHGEIRDAIQRILDRLVDKLQAAETFSLDLVHEQYTDSAPEETSVHSEEYSDLSSNSSLDLSVDSEDGLGVVTTHSPTERVEELITNLYKITSVIKKPVSSREDDLVRAWSLKNAAQLEEELKDLRSYVEWRMQRQFPELLPILRDRIIDSCVRRRQRLLYRSIHRVALQGSVNDWFVPGEMGSIERTSPENRYDAHSSLAYKSHARPFKLLESGLNLSIEDDQASSVPTHGFSQRAKSVVLSDISPSLRQTLDGLDVPPPPQQHSGSTEAVCPYCNLPLREELRSNVHWTRHILRDIDPYVCLFENCETPLRSYKTKEDWVAHMARQHTTIWSCQAKSHADHLFMDEEGLAAHLRMDHRDDIPEHHIPLMTQRGEKAMSDPFAVLASRHKSYACPFAGPKCAERVEAFRLESSLHIPEFPERAFQKVRDHIAGHLEAVALLCLPHHADAESQDSSARVLDDLYRPPGRTDSNSESELTFDDPPTKSKNEMNVSVDEPPAGNVDWFSLFGDGSGPYPSFPPADQDVILLELREAAITRRSSLGSLRPSSPVLEPTSTAKERAIAYPEETEFLKAAKQKLFNLVQDWYALDTSAFGVLLRCGSVQVSKDFEVWQSLEGYLFSEILILAKDKMDVESLNPKHSFSLKGSILIPKHMTALKRVHPSDENVYDDLELSFSVTELPKIWLRFYSSAQSESWHEALTRLMPLRRPVSRSETRPQPEDPD